MSEVAINYKGSSIATMDASGTKTLLTEGKYCEDDIEVAYTRPSGGGGLEYETGTWTPTSDTTEATISFSQTHTIAPILVMICDSDESARAAYSGVYSCYGNVYGFLGFPLTQGTAKRYGYNGIMYVGSTNFTATQTTSSTTSNLDQYVSSTGFLAYTASSSRYWRSNRTYKWIAVWAPTT